MDNMIINTSSCKITPKTDLEIQGICQALKIKRSRFFLAAVQKGLELPFNERQKIEKISFSDGIKKQPKHKSAKNRYRMIGSRVTLEMKVAVKAYCKKYSITESQFYRWALKMETLAYHQKKPVSTLRHKPQLKKEPIIPILRSPVQEFLHKQEKVAWENLKKRQLIENIIGLVVIVAFSRHQ